MVSTYGVGSTRAVALQLGFVRLLASVCQGVRKQLLHHLSRQSVCVGICCSALCKLYMYWTVLRQSSQILAVALEGPRDVLQQEAPPEPDIQVLQPAGSVCVS